MHSPEPITIETTINKPVASVWSCWTDPNHVVNWNFASDDWHCPEATSDFQVEGGFSYRMAAKDGSMAFDFEGTFKEIDPHKKIVTELGDGRKVEVLFSETEGFTRVVETFDPDNQAPIDMQQQGWQMILNNFKIYAESL